MTSLSILASGSDGNAALLTSEHTRILIDCGLSAKALVQRMSQITFQEGLDGILISHEHGDHVGGIVPVLRTYMKRGTAVPIYLTRETAEVINWKGIESPPVKLFEAGQTLQIGDIAVETFTISHDAADPINFVFQAPDCRIGFSTDLGFVPPAMTRKFADCQIVILESNYDPDMLANGPHPIEVKERVAGPTGHLSNEQAAEFIAGLDGRTRKIVLSHLSLDNNTVQLATWAARRAMLMAGIDAELLVASQTSPLRVL